MENEIWLFNPASPRGSSISGMFASREVDLPENSLRAFPIDVAHELRKRYPFLSETIDHPGAAGKLPSPPSGLVTAEKPKEAEVIEDVPPVYEDGVVASAPNSVSEVDVKEATVQNQCDKCPFVGKTSGGLQKHKTSVHIRPKGVAHPDKLKEIADDVKKEVAKGLLEKYDGMTEKEAADKADEIAKLA